MIKLFCMIIGIVCLMHLNEFINPFMLETY